MKTTSENIVAEIVKNNVATEQQINLICRRLNAGEKIDLQDIWDNPKELTDEQNKKGFDFLMNLLKTPNGKERVNSPFGYREEAVLEAFTGFEFAGTYDAGNRNHSFHVPLYNCNSNNGSFQYYYSGGKINIVSQPLYSYHLLFWGDLLLNNLPENRRALQKNKLQKLNFIR